MNIPLPASAFPLGAQGGTSGVFVVAVVIGLAMFLSTRAATIPKTAQR